MLLKDLGWIEGIAVGELGLGFCSFSLYVTQYVSVYNHEYIQLKSLMQTVEKFSFLEAGSEK